MDRAGWEQQQHVEEREMRLDEALEECLEKGVSREALRTLLYETGSRWMPDDNANARTASVAR